MMSEKGELIYLWNWEKFTFLQFRERDTVWCEVYVYVASVRDRSLIRGNLIQFQPNFLRDVTNGWEVLDILQRAR